jgi:hypothetical protein
VAVGAPVAAPPLHVGAAARADVVSGLAQRDGGAHVLAAQGAGERLEQAVTHAATGRTSFHSCCNRQNFLSLVQNTGTRGGTAPPAGQSWRHAPLLLSYLANSEAWRVKSHFTFLTILVPNISAPISGPSSERSVRYCGRSSQLSAARSHSLSALSLSLSLSLPLPLPRTSEFTCSRIRLLSHSALKLESVRCSETSRHMVCRAPNRAVLQFQGQPHDMHE